LRREPPFPANGVAVNLKPRRRRPGELTLTVNVSLKDARVFTVVLNYQHAHDTIRCVESIRRSTYVRQNLLVVDNGSDAAVTDVLRSSLPATRLIENEDNLGYAGGNNVGIQSALDAGADWVWILNADVTVEPEALERLVDLATRRPNAGILGSRILYGSPGPRRIWFDGGILDLNGGGTSHRNDGILESTAPANGPQETDYVTGAGMLVRREVFADIGLLPEEWFLYFEETEFNLLAARRGWELLIDPRSVLVHHKRSTGTLPAPYYVYYYVRNRLIFFERHSVLSFEEVLNVLDASWIRPWRMKIAERAPAVQTQFDELVAAAVGDARKGRLGRHAVLPVWTDEG
jgi:GT2 family glycosyltransferase